jgi:hypothetical protein
MSHVNKLIVYSPDKVEKVNNEQVYILPPLILVIGFL